MVCFAVYFIPLPDALYEGALYEDFIWCQVVYVFRSSRFVNSATLRWYGTFMSSIVFLLCYSVFLPLIRFTEAKPSTYVQDVLSFTQHLP